MFQSPLNIRHPLISAFQEFVRDPLFPCVGAKAALSKQQMTFVVAHDIKSAWDDLGIHAQVRGLVDLYRENRAPFRSLAVIFGHDSSLDELEFEQYLWERLQSLSDKDDWLGQKRDARVAHDPNHPEFSLSFGGEAFFIVGLHPQASRPARRFVRPTMIFNLHDQFEMLREANQYEKLRASILDRDLKVAGTMNPMLAKHGEVSAARQYSGRAVESGWKCPYQRAGLHPDLELLDAITD
ncbi:guanitoxin biosynthesis heme-dependent pre-guanitoxin N-hydroxylase GntA [Sphingorhabdus sp.]|jgi:FPC/CPF motif-containing protein YcgG|uniref:guanitoxin biosynthesis heme-dependent pre-guanitoxin N-hydroxylase GntA n=1 Tax=Sphingorhabdus sp. TaxID=1902408 RepID=UPI0037CA2A29